MGEAPEALILVGSPCVMEAVTYGRKKVRVAVKWDNTPQVDVCKPHSPHYLHFSTSYHYHHHHYYYD
jgi:hypothetical protein